MSADGCIHESNNFWNSFEDVKPSEGQSVVINLNDAVSRAPPVQLLKQKRREKKQRHRQNKQARKVEQRTACKETFELLGGRANSSEDAALVKEWITVARRDASEDVPSEKESPVPVTAADDELSTISEILHEIREDITVPPGVAPPGQGSQLQAVNDLNTASPDPDQTESATYHLATLPQDMSLLRALCLPKQSDPSYDLFTQLRSIAIAHTASHSQNFADLPEERKRQVFEETLVYAMLKTIAAARRPQCVVDQQHEPVGEQTTRNPDDVGDDSLETGKADHEQLAIPEESVSPSASSSPDCRIEAVQDPPLPVEVSVPREHIEGTRDIEWKCGFSWIEDVEEEEERRQQKALERPQQDDAEQHQLEALRRSPTTLARLRQTLAPIAEDDEEHW